MWNWTTGIHSIRISNYRRRYEYNIYSCMYFLNTKFNTKYIIKHITTNHTGRQNNTKYNQTKYILHMSATRIKRMPCCYINSLLSQSENALSCVPVLSKQMWTVCETVTCTGNYSPLWLCWSTCSSGTVPDWLVSSTLNQWLNASVAARSCSGALARARCNLAVLRLWLMSSARLKASFLVWAHGHIITRQ